MEEIKDFSSEIIEDANQYLSGNSIMFKQDKNKDTYSYNPAPVSLQPSSFSHEVYCKIRENQTIVNSMIEELMKNIELIYEFLEPISKVDPFIGSLIKISHSVRKLPYSQLGYLGVWRTDYMTTEENEVKLVELNTIASGLGFISDKMKGFYEYLIGKHYSTMNAKNLPEDCENTDQIADSMKAAVDLYVAHKQESPKKVILAYIVDYTGVTICDQKLIENALYFKHKIISRRLTFSDISEFWELKENGELIYKGREEIAVVYYRSGYSPSQYKDKNDWDARETLEKSLAIKCPNVDLQLLTFKKIQEVLSKEKNWEKLLGTSDFDNIKGLFKNQMWGFEEIDTETKAIIADAKANPDTYVLKTQREGGGNNYFGDDIPYVLEKTEELMNYSLMKKIYPQEFEGTFLRNNKVYQGKCVSEIGIFGTLLVKTSQDDSREVLINKGNGFLMRTKGSNTNEGGVYGGFAFIDFIYFK